VIGQGLASAGLGLAIGCVVALLVTRFLRSFLFGISAADMPTWMGDLTVIAAVATLACYLPAQHAANIEPQEALRTD
jgi:ABC-type antimicrobial peptide transport system permease subunit